MKKTLSIVLAIVMALSVFSGISFSAFAAEVTKGEFIPVEPMELVENIDGWYCEDENGEKYFEYYPSFSDGDAVVLTFGDGSTEKYVYEDYDFYNESEEPLDWYYSDDQYENHWSLGEHCFTLIVYDIEIIFEASIIENPVLSAEASFDMKTIIENTNGYWDIDDNDNQYFYYDIEYVFDEGDSITVNMKDGTSVVYTMKEMYFEDEDWSYYAFFNDDGEELLIGCYDDAQYENHWGVGNQSVTVLLIDMGIDFEFTLEITEGSEETCWHNTDWQFKNGIYQSECPGCGKVTKIPFTDISGLEKYADFIAYTSVYNDYIRGTNPPANNVFAPLRTINRAMLVTILYRMAGEPYSNGRNPYSSTPFTDITDKSAYYYDAACWALKNGITTETTFKPLDSVTREQTATLLFRYAKLNDMLGDDGYKYIELDTEYYDSALIHPWAKEAMQWANYNDMITGTEQGFSNPGFATLRIHATKILFGFGWLCDIGNFE